MSQSTPTTLLVIASNPKDADLLQDIFSDFPCTQVESYPEALNHVCAHAVAGIFVAFETDCAEILGFMQEANKHQPDAQKILWADYTQLPAIIGTPLGDLLNRIMPKPGKAETMQRVIAELFDTGNSTSPNDTFYEQTHAAFDWLNAEKLLRWSTTSACHISGCVLRCLPTDLRAGQMQFVLKNDDAADALIERLNDHWGSPYKSANTSMSLREKQHPLVKHIGRLWKPQTLYMRQVHDQETYVYLIVLPWEKKPKLTIILGIHSTSIKLPYTQILEGIHQDAFDEVSQFVVPTRIGDLRELDGPQYISEYDWVMTHSYLGPDRRAEPTPFLNQYAYHGKRKTIPKIIEDGQGAFVDRMAPWVLYLFVFYLFLSSLDTCFTYWFVRSGDVIELNPLLRPLITEHPWIFVFVKNLFSISSFLLVARLQLFRIGKILLPFNVAVYFCLDIYWFILVGPKLMGF
jgi:hypothetical protein